MSKTKLAYLTALDGQSGAEIQANMLSDFLAKHFDLTLVNAIGTNAPTNFIVRVKENNYSLMYPKTVEEGLLDLNPDICLVHVYSPELFANLRILKERTGMTMGLRHGISLMEHHLTYLMRNNNPDYVITLFNDLDFFDFIICPSKKVEEEIKLWYGDKVQTEVIPVAVQPDIYVPTPFMEDGILRILVATRHAPNNFISVILSMMKRLEQEIPCSMQVIGGGVRDYTQLFSRIVEKCGLKNVYISSFVSEEQKRRVFEKADIVLIPSISHQGVPLSVVEALSSGTIPIVSDLPVMNEIESTIKVRHDSIIDWQKEIKKLFYDQKLAKRLILKGLQEVEKFRIDKIIKQYVKLFKRFV